MKKKYLLLAFLFCISAGLFAQQKDSLNPRKLHFEVSFGNSLLFISSSKQTDILTNSAVVVPTTALLLFTEFRSDKFMRIPVFCSFPTESKQFLVDGELINEKASTTLGTGLQLKLFRIKMDDKSKIECTLGPLASFIIDTKNKVRMAPILAGRLRITRGSNIVMYLGASYSFGIDAMGILYGTGTVF